MINEVASTNTTVVDNDTREKNIYPMKYYQDEKKELTIMKSKTPEEY